MRRHAPYGHKVTMNVFRMLLWPWRGQRRHRDSVDAAPLPELTLEQYERLTPHQVLHEGEMPVVYLTPNRVTQWRVNSLFTKEPDTIEWIRGFQPGEVFVDIGANVGMILFGWLQERMNPPGRSSTTMMPFWFGTIAGVLPWIGIWTNVIGADTVPGFVFGIVVAEQILFFSFGLNQWLQYKGVGKWSNYLHGEKVYLVLSLVAKSLLAWQIYGGSLAN
mgnify:CR=1 FL=1